MSLLWQPGVTLREVEKEVILKALQFFQNNKTKTAIALGVSVRTIDNKLAKYGIDQGEEADDGKGSNRGPGDVTGGDSGLLRGTARD